MYSDNHPHDHRYSEIDFKINLKITLNIITYIVVVRTKYRDELQIDTFHSNYRYPNSNIEIFNLNWDIAN